MASPEPAEVLRRVIESRLLDVHTSFPGRVEKYDASTQRADIQPMVKNVVADPDGTTLVEDLPVIPSVPVAFPRGGGYFASFPLQKGDFVLVVCCERSVGQFLAKGALSHPVDLEMHGFSGAVAYPGLYPDSRALEDDGVADGLVVGKEGGPLVYINGSKIELGAKGAGDKVPVDSSLQSELSAIKGALDTIITSFDLHTHNTTSPGAPTLTPLVPIGSNPYSVSPTASELVTIDS